MSIALTLHGTVEQWVAFYACLSFPVVLFGVVLTWVIFPPKSDWALFCWPVLVGWIVAAWLAWAMWGPRFWQGFIFIGKICTVGGLAIGGGAAVVKAYIKKSKIEAKHGVKTPPRQAKGNWKEVPEVGECPYCNATLSGDEKRGAIVSHVTNRFASATLH